jgi:tape measure domain-containing protein
MILLARALAQVNNMGKLMGQEKNQLVNAGFNLKYVAEAAGVTMEEFQDAMKNGEISAEHVMEALDKMVSRGGTHFGLLNARAETLNGSMDRTGEKFNRLFRDIGESESGLFKGAVNGAEMLADELGRAAAYWGLITDPDSIFVGTSADPNLEVGVTNKDGSVGGYREKPIPEENLRDPEMAGMLFGPQARRAAELENQRRQANQELVYLEADRLARKQAEEDAEIERKRQEKLERDRRKATQAKAGAKGAASPDQAYQYGGLQGLYNRYAAHQTADQSQLPQATVDYENMGIDFYQIGFDVGQGVASVLPSSDTVGSMIGYGMGLLGAENPADRALREGLDKMFPGDEGPYADMPPALREVFEKRDRKLERLERRDRMAEASRSVVGTAGRFGQGGEYEFLSRVREEQEKFKRQEKRDKERNDKLDNIDENTKNQVEQLAETDKAIADYISRQNSI